MPTNETCLICGKYPQLTELFVCKVCKQKLDGLTCGIIAPLVPIMITVYCNKEYGVRKATVDEVMFL